MSAETRHAGEGEIRVSSLELFFDLVFVFTLTQLTALLEHELSLEGAARVLLIFVVLFWMYGAYVWLTNQVPSARTGRRLFLIAAMAAFLVCALAIPAAFAEAGVAFGIGYLLVVLVHTGLYTDAYGRAVIRFAPLNVVGALLVIAAGFVDGAARYALWVAPIGLQYLTSRLAAGVGEENAAGFDIRPGHFVERHGLLLLVAFGESVVAIGIGVAAVPLDAGAFGAAVLGSSWRLRSGGRTSSRTRRWPRGPCATRRWPIGCSGASTPISMRSSRCCSASWS